MTPAPAPRFSVVVPTFERPDFLREALESVVAQTIDDFECIVVDDGGGGVEGSIPADPRVRVIRHEQSRGSAAARNTGIEASRGQLLCFLDDDDLYTPNRLELGAAGTDRASIGLCRSTIFGDGRTPSQRGRALAGNVHDEILDSTTPHLGLITLRRDAMLPFDATYSASADIEWWIRTSVSATVATIDECGYEYRFHGGVRHGNTVTARIESSLRMMDQHSEYFACHPRAAAFRWRRIGVMHATLGDRREARAALRRSLRIHATPGAARDLVRQLDPRG